MTIDSFLDSYLPRSALQKAFHAAMFAACQQSFIVADPTAEELGEMWRDGGYATLDQDTPRLTYPHTVYKKRLIDIAVRIQKRKGADNGEPAAKRRPTGVWEWAKREHDDDNEEPPAAKRRSVSREEGGKRKRDEH
jgi:hypothetical protein